jgi:hypothetical protein
MVILSSIKFNQKTVSMFFESQLFIKKMRFFPLDAA